jgi:hypothetical protein
MGASGHIQMANTRPTVSAGAGPPGTSRVTLRVPADPHKVSSFLNIRVADIQACYELWSREADLSQSRRKSTARFAATCAILTVTLSR